MSGEAVDAAAAVPRPRFRDEELFAAVVGLLREVGYDRLTMDAVATRARVSKATMYRHWPGKAELVADAIRHRHVILAMPRPATNLRDDLLYLVQGMARLCTEDGLLMQAVGFAMQSNPELGELVRSKVFPVARQYTGDVLDRAFQRGELSRDRDYDMFHDLVPAVVMSRCLGQGRELDDEYLNRVVDEVLLPVLRA